MFAHNPQIDGSNPATGENVKMKPMEQHILDTNAGKQLSLAATDF